MMILDWKSCLKILLVIVNPVFGNEAPTVFLPPASYEIINDWSLCLVAQIEDDGLPDSGVKSIDWTVNGDVTAYNLNQDGKNCEVTFSTAGEFNITVTASDGEQAVAKTIYISVSADGIYNVTPFEEYVDVYKDARRTWSALKSQFYTSGFVNSAMVGFDPNQYFLEEESSVIVTILYDGARARNSLGWYDANNVTTENASIIWSDASAGVNKPFEQGAKASLGILPKGVALRFFLVEDGATGGDVTFSQDSELNLNQKQMVAGLFDSEDKGRFYLAFEDRFNGDNSYDDLVLQIDIDPVSEGVVQFDSPEGGEGMESDRGGRGVKQRLLSEGIADSESEVVTGVFQIPNTAQDYRIDFLDDRSGMKFTFGLVDLDKVRELPPSSLLFRELAIKHGHLLLDDRSHNPGDSIYFNTGALGVNGKKVMFYLIPNNTPATYLRNAWRYTPRGNGANTKRQPLFSVNEGNPEGMDQFLIFDDQQKMVFCIEDYSRADTVESGASSAEFFDNIQLRLSPSIPASDYYSSFYGQSISALLQDSESTGLAPDDDAYDAAAIMENARGSRRYDLLFSTTTQPDGAYLVDEFGASLPISNSGALSVNIDYENGLRSDFFIEQQRYGADVIETGILLGDKALIKEGIKMINWGLRQQASNGSFPNCGDEVHSSSLFLEALSRAGIALKRENPRRYRRVIKKWRRKAHALSRWFLIADDVGRSVNLTPYPHRYFLRGAALAQTAHFTRDRKLRPFADIYISEGMTFQQADGAFLEKGTYDASYQMVGMAFASRYFATSTNQDLRSDLTQTMWDGMSYFLSGVETDGSITLNPLSRTVTESSRSGAAKTVDYKHMTRALVFAEEGLFMTGAEQAADLILTYAGKL